MFRLTLLIIVIFFKSCCGLFNPFYFIAEYTYCQLPNVECCSSSSISPNLVALEEDLRKNLYGQHIVIQQIIPALRSHFHKNVESSKPLVISFHGGSGTGKNFVAKMIAKHIYSYDLQSKFVHQFGKSDFPVEADVNKYKVYIKDKVLSEVRKCPHSMFIFDEIHLLPKGVFEAISTFLDYHNNVKDADFSKAIFIFLTNNAGEEILDKLYELRSLGVERDSTEHHHFEEILEIGAYALNGGLQGCSLLKANLIDHFVPFLPLEKKHVRKCIITEYFRWKVNPTERSISEILSNYVVYDPHHHLYVDGGCKRVDGKVRIDVMNNYRVHKT
ncbi:torsin-like protein [Condylostylus longicornis]|uniref:torsin-like protein n=1 Tax=Condylostylus longicornis TaxID=2530218 RepID=UPI00244DE4F4|nr:torsin-like protein [Condylostylus longicornis]